MGRRHDAHLPLAGGRKPGSGRRGAGYLLQAEDVGKTVTVSVTGSRTGYDSVTRTSAPTGAVQPRSLGDSDCAVVIRGKAKVGKTLRSSVSACPAGATLRYQLVRRQQPDQGGERRDVHDQKEADRTAGSGCWSPSGVRATCRSCGAAGRTGKVHK